MSEQSKGSKAIAKLIRIIYRRLMKAYYLIAKTPLPGKNSLITSGGPVEPLYAMGSCPLS
jgi:hypothetical protein